MRPTLGPDPAMPEEYGEFPQYEGYDEDEFFYHMYFDEVSTTPLPEEFYDILESVSNSGGDYVSNYPDYFDYILKSGLGSNTSDSEISTQPSLRQSKNTSYLQFGDENTFKNPRRNSKFMKLKQRNGKNSEQKIRGKRSVTPKHSEIETFSVSPVRTKRSSVKSKKRNKRRHWLGFRKRKQVAPGVIGILDRNRPPGLFRQSEFVTIKLASFVVLSTGVTNVLTQSDFANVIIAPVNIVKPIINIPTISAPTSSWKPDSFATWPFITITGVSASNITYLLVSLFILYVGIILYVDGDYLYNKVRDFAIGRFSRLQSNLVRRVHTGAGLHSLTDTLTSAWDAMRANFGVEASAAAPHGWVAPGPQPSVYRRRRPYRRRRRKYQRKDSNDRDQTRKSSDEIYSSSNYYRKATPTRSDRRNDNLGYSSSSWYNGDYQEDFLNTYKYQQSYEDSLSDYKDAYSWDSKHYDNY